MTDEKRQRESRRLLLLTELERPLWEANVRVGGTDEVGRGPLAGPVVTACVMCRPPFDPNNLIEGVNDSKKVSPKRRNAIAKLIKDSMYCSIGLVECDIIDEINILNATKLAFCRAYEAMSVKPDLLLVDAVKNLNIDVKQHAIIKGDTKSYLIAAASILAKVTRDDIMIEYDKLYPEYGFLNNKGYGTQQHMAALKKYGPCEIHRRTFLKAFDF